MIGVSTLFVCFLITDWWDLFASICCSTLSPTIFLSSITSINPFLKMSLKTPEREVAYLSAPPPRTPTSVPPCLNLSVTLIHSSRPQSKLTLPLLRVKQLEWIDGFGERGKEKAEQQRRRESREEGPKMVWWNEVWWSKCFAMEEGEGAGGRRTEERFLK